MRILLIGMFLGLMIIVAALPASAQMHSAMPGPDSEMRGPGMMMDKQGQQGCGMMMGMDMGMHRRGMMTGEDHSFLERVMGLGLDEKQKDAVNAVHSKTKKEMIKKQAEWQITHIDLKDLLAKDAVDMKAVEALAKKCESLRTDMFLSHVKMHEEIKTLLTVEQKKNLKEPVDAGHDGDCKDCSMMNNMMRNMMETRMHDHGDH